MQNKTFFIDFEASSLVPGSWPIEIGLAWVSSQGVEVWSSLIRPAQDWGWDKWSEQSEQVHGIHRTDLERAPEAQAVVAEVLARVGQGRLLSDAPEFDGRWLSTLFMSAGASPLHVECFHTAAAAAFQGASLDWLYEGLERRRAPHRAGPDARRLAAAWRDGRLGPPWLCR